MSDTLNEIFDVDPALVMTVASKTALIPAQPASNVFVVEAKLVTDDTTKLNADFEAARINIAQITKDATEAAKSAILLAQSGDSPRAYEVVATMLTAIVNANKELVHLHKAKKDAAPASNADATEGSGVTIEKAVFVGRAADLLRELRSIQKIK